MPQTKHTRTVKLQQRMSKRQFAAVTQDFLVEVTWKECKSLLASFQGLISNSSKFKQTQISRLFKHSATITRKLMKTLNETGLKRKRLPMNFKYAWTPR